MRSEGPGCQLGGDVKLCDVNLKIVVKLCGVNLNQDYWFQVSGGHKGRPNETYDYDLSSPVATECVGTEKTHHKMKKRYRKEKVLDNQNRWFHQNFNYTKNIPEA